MPIPPEPESSNTTIRPDLRIRAKSGSITETITDAFTSLPAKFRRRPLSQAPSSSSDPSYALSQMISKITLKDIQDAKHCGGGGFGTVRIFEHPTNGKVALKQLRVSGGQLSDDLRRRTFREGETWQDLKHPHVLPFLGILETPTDLYLVSPYVKNGALDAYLRQNPDVDRQMILWKTAGAIAYLHKHGIIHGDIKAANILVSNDVEPLLCDFGLAKSDDGVTSVGLQGVGTVRFQSPEVLTEGGGKSFASDAWAFGMTIFEVLSGKVPFHQYASHTAIISAVVLRDERPATLPSHSPSGLSFDRIWSVARSCWRKDPLLRGSMQDILRGLLPTGVTLRGHTAGITCLTILPDGMTVVSGSIDRTIRLWDVASGTQRGRRLKGHTDQINCLVVSPGGLTIISGSYDCTIRLWDVASGSQRGGALTGHTGPISCLEISPDGSTIVSGSYDHTLRLWDLASGSQRGRTLRGHTTDISCVAISPDGLTIISGSQDRTLRLWDMTSGRRLGKPLMGHTAEITCVAVSPDGRSIASGSGSRDSTLQLWDMASGSQQTEPLKGHTAWITCLAISPNGMTVVSGSGSWDGTLRLWDMTSGRQRGQPLWGHKGKVTCLAFSPDGTTIVSGSEDCTLRLWDTTSGSQLGEPLRGHTKAITCLAISQDGKIVVSGSADETLRMWDMTSGSNETND